MNIGIILVSTENQSRNILSTKKIFSFRRGFNFIEKYALIHPEVLIFFENYESIAFVYVTIFDLKNNILK